MDTPLTIDELSENYIVPRLKRDLFTVDLIGSLQSMRDVDREYVFAHLRQVFCVNCGSEQPHCPCMNDE